MIAQAEHMPVHLGAMPDAVAAVLERDPRPGDVYALNDPYTGGTHLPDITLVALVGRPRPRCLARPPRRRRRDAARLSLPAGARSSYQEGLVIPPLRLTDEVVQLLARQHAKARGSGWPTCGRRSRA